MEMLEYIQAVESGLQGTITPDSELESVIYECFADGDAVQYVLELVSPGLRTDVQEDIDYGFVADCDDLDAEEKERVERIQTAIKVLFRDVNSLATNGKTSLGMLLNEVVSKEHRTLQQCFMRQLSIFFEQYSKISSSDLRNQASIEYAKKIAKSTEYWSFPFV